MAAFHLPIFGSREDEKRMTAKTQIPESVLVIARGFCTFAFIQTSGALFQTVSYSYVELQNTDHAVKSTCVNEPTDVRRKGSSISHELRVMLTGYASGGRHSAVA